MNLLEHHGASFKGGEAKGEYRSPWMLLYLTAALEKDIEPMELWLVMKGWPRSTFKDNKNRLKDRMFTMDPRWIKRALAAGLSPIEYSEKHRRTIIEYGSFLS